MSRQTPDPVEIERLAREDWIELAPGEAAELAPVIASLTDLGELLEQLEGLLELPVPAGRDPG